MKLEDLIVDEATAERMTVTRALATAAREKCAREAADKRHAHADKRLRHARRELSLLDRWEQEMGNADKISDDRLRSWLGDLWSNLTAERDRIQQVQNENPLRPEIARRWRAGESTPAIAAALDITEPSVHGQIRMMRADGIDLPSRKKRA